VSLAASKAAAKTLSLPLYRYIGRLLDGERSIKLPVPMFNVINGGQHANNNIDFQEFMAVPTGFKTFQERLDAGKNIFNSLRLVLEERNLKTDVGDEGGYAPDLDTNEMAFGLMEEATKQAGFTVGKDVYLAIDVAAAYLPPTFQLTTEHYVDLIKTYPIISIEDPLPSDDWHWWGQLKKAIDLSNKTGRPVYIVGDDIFMTHSDRLRKGITEAVANAVLIKINQVGTLTETLDTIKLAKENNYTTIVSHRAGETLDTFISDLAVGTGADFMKAGAPNDYHMERMSKYIRLVEIEKEILG
jgi:enolase